MEKNHFVVAFLFKIKFWEEKMRPDLEKIKNLGNQLKSILETSDKFVKNSWLEKYENWLIISYNGKQINPKYYDGYWQKCNIFFKFNDTEYFLLFPWQEICVDNSKNKTQVTKNKDKRLDGDSLKIWKNNSDKKKMWLIYICPDKQKSKLRNDNIRVCTYNTLIPYFKTKL